MKQVITVSGTSKVASNIRAAAQQVERAAIAAAYRAMERVMTRSKEEFVPVDTGTLRSTGHVEPPRREGDVVTIVAGFGGPAAPYALRQHEDLTLHHQVGQAKYLEKPFLEEQQTIVADIRGAVSSVVG